MAERIAAVILAGGKGERLGGVVKATLTVGGRRLLDRVTEAVAGTAPIYVAHGAIAPERLGLNSVHVPVADLATDYAGPLAGLVAAVAALTEVPDAPELLLSVAVDTPFLPPGFPDILRSALGDGDAVIARYGGQDYPTNALWRVSALRDLPRRTMVGAAPHSLRRLARELGAQMLDWPLSEDGDPFANANTYAELEALERRAGREFSVPKR